MNKRQNLRNPDLLAFDYVSVLIEWVDNPFTFRVVKVIESTFPFNAQMLSVQGTDNNTTVTFTFQSVFDILTSPWQFDLELAIIPALGLGKYKPYAVYNGSNNQVTVKFPLPGNNIPVGSFVIFTAKRYRPNKQYLAELATASANPVSIQGGGGSPTLIPIGNYNLNSSLSITQGFYFTAPTDFTLTSIEFAITGIVSGGCQIVQLNAPPSTNNLNVLYNSGLVSTQTVNVGLFIPNNTTIAVFSRVSLPGNSNITPCISATSSVNTTINGFSTTVQACYASTTPSSSIVSTINTVTAPYTNMGITKLYYSGTPVWSNIIY